MSAATDGPAFFRSRWVDVPEGAVEAAGGLPAGFRAAGVAAGLKPSGSLDVGLLVCDAPEATSAARFTRSGVLAAPVLVCRQRTKLDALRAVVANSGCANAATGGRGFDDAVKVQGAGAIASGVREDRVAVASTGVIGVPLDTQAMVSGLLQRGAPPARRRRRRLRRGDHDHRRLREARDARRHPAQRRHGAPERAGQGRGHDPAELRDDAVLRADRRGAERRRRPTCCSA